MRVYVVNVDRNVLDDGMEQNVIIGVYDNIRHAENAIEDYASSNHISFMEHRPLHSITGTEWIYSAKRFDEKLVFHITEHEVA